MARETSLYSTLQVAELVAVSYGRCLRYAMRNDLPRCGSTFVWNEVDIDRFENWVDGKGTQPKDDEDDEADEHEPEAEDDEDE